MSTVLTFWILCMAITYPIVILDTLNTKPGAVSLPARLMQWLLGPLYLGYCLGIIYLHCKPTDEPE